MKHKKVMMKRCFMYSCEYRYMSRRKKYLNAIKIIYLIIFKTKNRISQFIRLER